MCYKKCTKCIGLVYGHEFDESTNTCHLCLELAAEAKKAKKKEYARKYRAKNKDKIKAAAAKYRAENRDEIKAKRREYLATEHGRKASNEAARRWSKKNPDKMAERDAKIRADRNGAPSEKWTMKEVYESAKGVCHHCNESIPFSDMHADHYIPLSKGGSNLRENIVCSCSFCNYSKKDKLPSEWISPKLIGGSN